MDTKSTAKLAAFWLIVVMLLVTSTGMAPVSVQAQDESPTQELPQVPAGDASQPADADPATGYIDGSEPTAPEETLARYPTTAAYDSGWVAINPGQTMELTHNLGGSVDNYVVDLRFYGASPTLDNHGYNQIMYGGDQLIAPVPEGYAVDDEVGAFWHSLNPTSIKVYRLAQDKAYVTMIRVRIWVVTEEDFDSGWQDITANSSISIPFSISGGTADNYLVYLEFKDTRAVGFAVHQRFYGGFDQAVTNDRGGAYWRALTDTSIQVFRRAEELYINQVRVRIWNQPKATYDSGWVNGNLGTYVNLAHNIGGNPDDYIVDLQFKDPNNGMGVNQRCYGGCDLRTLNGDYSNTKQGAYWRRLTSTNIEVGRRADDVFADQVRVRIWNFWTPTRPDYDSGWKTNLPGSISQPFHYLGGSEDDYLVNFVYSDATWKANQMYYGVKYFGANPPSGYSADQSAGAYWRSLTNSSVVVFRAPNDNTVDQWRLRIWRMPKPDYDSGWQAISPGELKPFNHGLIGNRADFLVDLTFNDTGGSGKNQRYLGGAVTTDNQYHGAFWNAFTTAPGNAKLNVYRLLNDLYADQVRVRIWRVNTPDYESGYLDYTPGLVRIITHNLNTDPGLMLVDITANQVTGDHKVFYGRVDIGTGGPFPTYAENDRAGFLWNYLTDSAIAVQRLNEDDNAQTINTRIWILPSIIYLPLIQR